MLRRLQSLVREELQPSLDDPFVAEQRRLVLQRLRLGTLLGLVPIGLSALVTGLFLPQGTRQDLTSLGCQAILCALAALLTWRRRAERSAVVLAAGTVLGITTMRLLAVAAPARDLDAVLYPMVATMLAAALMFPWGAVAQAVVSAAVAAGYLCLPVWSALDPIAVATIITGTVAGIGTSVTGALLVDRQHRSADRQRRATSVARERVAASARQSQILLEVGRELNATIDLAQLVKLVTRLGQRLVLSDVTTLSVLDGRRGIFRTIAISSDTPESAEALRGLEFPADPQLVDALAQHRVISIPGDAGLDRLQQVGARYGVQRMLLAAIRRDGKLIGLLGFMQRAPEPRFGEQSIRLAEGIAHQAAIALANARLFEELRSASQVKSTFVSTMSHELRTPINIILGFAEMARDCGVNEGERNECLSRIDTAARDLLDLVETTLAIGKMEAGRDDVRLEPVSLKDFWTGLGAFCGRLPRKPGVGLDWGREVPTAPLVTDPRKLTVVLRNLVGNALKFTERGRVRAWMYLKGKRLVIAVSDTGIGIRPEEQKNVFEMFRQADGSDSRRFGGTGLGLYIVRQYVQQLGGTIELESIPGRGSTFRVTLPFRVAEGGARDAA